MPSHVPSPGNIENILRMDVEIAKKEYDSCHSQFLNICSAGSPGEIEESSKRLQLAREAHAVATKRLNDFMRNGTVPENL